MRDELCKVRSTRRRCCIQYRGFLATNPKESRALQAALEPYMDRAFRRANQFYLYSAPWTPVGIWARKPITSIDAIQGLNIRTYDANGTSTMKAAGAAAIQLSWADVIPAFSTGTIDAVLTSDEGAQICNERPGSAPVRAMSAGTFAITSPSNSMRV